MFEDKQLEILEYLIKERDYVCTIGTISCRLEIPFQVVQYCLMTLREAECVTRHVSQTGTVFYRV